MRSGGWLRAEQPTARGFKGGWLGNVRSALLSVVFPAGCRIGEQLLSEATRIPICNECLASFRAISSTACDKCGRPIEGADTSDAEAFVCPTCVNDEWGGYAFQRVRSWANIRRRAGAGNFALEIRKYRPAGKTVCSTARTVGHGWQARFSG